MSSPTEVTSCLLCYSTVEYKKISVDLSTSAGALVDGLCTVWGGEEWAQSTSMS